MSKAWKLFIVNAVFFGLFLIAFLYETTIPNHELQYFDFSVIFIPAYVLYIVFYGIFSFLYTKKIILPNVQFFFFSLVFFYIGLEVPFHWLSSSIPKVNEALVFVVVSVGISLGFSLLSKGIHFIVNKEKSVRIGNIIN